MKKEKFFKKDYTSQKVKYFNRLTEENGSIIDYGGGDGKILELLDFNYKYIIDIEKRNDNIPFYYPGELDAKVDVVLICMALHHFEDLDVVLSEVSSLLKDNGILIIREADCDSEELIEKQRFMDELFYGEKFSNMRTFYNSKEYWEKKLSKKFTTEQIIYEKNNPYNVYWQKFKKLAK